MRMPDGATFELWEDTTKYEKVYHVACLRPDASDDNPGTEDRPFATIGRAAMLLQPGEKAIVHEGVYRESIRPARGGEGPEHMIAYEAAGGETVRIKGSEIWSQRSSAVKGGVFHRRWAAQRYGWPTFRRSCSRATTRSL